MKRKATKKSTRAARKDEKDFMSWTKYQPCIVCGSGPCVVDHAMGSAYIHNKVLVGHWFLLPLCQSCDSVKTHGSRRGFINRFGKMSELWKKSANHYDKDVPREVFKAILDCGM